MKIYRWYAERIGMGGVTVHSPETNIKDVEDAIWRYIVSTFKESNYIKEELSIVIWQIKDDDDYNDKFPTTIAVSY